VLRHKLQPHDPLATDVEEDSLAARVLDKEHGDLEAAE